MLQNVFIAVYSTMSEHNFKWSLIIQFVPNWECSGKTAGAISPYFSVVVSCMYSILVYCGFQHVQSTCVGLSLKHHKKISTKTSA